MKKILLVFVLPFFIVLGCEEEASGKYEHIQTVVNNSSIEVAFINTIDGSLFKVPANTTVEEGFYSGNALPLYFDEEKANYPRVSISSEIRNSKAYERIYTIENLKPISIIKITNNTEDSVTVAGKYLGDTYQKNGITITTGETKELNVYKEESYKAYSGEGIPEKEEEKKDKRLQLEIKSKTTKTAEYEIK